MDSIREQIAVALEAILKTIAVSNGYVTDIGEHTYRAAKTVDKFPSCVLWLGEEEAEKHHGSSMQTMAIAIDTYHNQVRRKSDDQVINMLIADVRKALETYNPTLAGLIESISYSGLGLEPPDDGQDICSASVNFLIEYKTVRGDPYSQP